METFKKWVNSPAGTGTALAISGIATFIFIGRGFDLNKSEWAYWVQALGSIGAIVGTWYATKTQLMHANKARKIQRLAEQAGHAHIAFDLATDTHRALRSIEKKFAEANKHTKRIRIPLDRLQALSQSLHNFAALPIHPVYYFEILCLQREVAFTISAVSQQAASPYVVMPERVINARKRTAAVLVSKLKLETALNRARSAAGIITPVIEREIDAEYEES
ncbi:hypothetical protein [Janthinobacterium sp. HLS12-2]|uniref:hypothetical protein n=1 Tax=Janthinobacterium sp. HLS12-2 TaxID=1259324 RepID=UPI003F1EA510